MDYCIRDPAEFTCVLYIEFLQKLSIGFRILIFMILIRHAQELFLLKKSPPIEITNLEFSNLFPFFSWILSFQYFFVVIFTDLWNQKHFVKETEIFNSSYLLVGISAGNCRGVFRTLSNIHERDFL